MKNKQDLEKQAEQTLNSLDNLQQLEANEFLDAKILHRMQVMHHPPAITAQKLMLRLAGVLCLFIGLNITTYFVLKQPKHTTTKNINGVDAFADAYGLNNNSNSY
jgi:hypothetical protein